MGDRDITPVLESIFFVSESPVKLKWLVELLPEWNEDAIRAGIERIKLECQEVSRGIELVDVAGGYQFRTKPDQTEWLVRLKKTKPSKFSQAALETLALVAYRHPITRSQIEDVRGVDSGWVLRTLLEKGLIKILGRKDLPGRPIIYGITPAFLELFGLNSLQDLPTLKEIQPPPVVEAMPDAEVTEEEVSGTEAENPPAAGSPPVKETEQ